MTSNISDSHFRADLLQVPWDTVCYDDPNTSWIVWKAIFYEILNKHAPLRHRRIKKLIMSRGLHLHAIKQLMRSRDYHKKKAIKYNSKIHWDKYKSLRNKANIQLRESKAKFYHKEMGTVLN